MENINEEEYDSGMSVDESGLGGGGGEEEEEDDAPKYPMHLGGNAVRTDKSPLSAVWEQSGDNSDFDDGTGRWRDIRGQNMGPVIIQEEMSSYEDSSEAQEEDSGDADGKFDENLD